MKRFFSLISTLALVALGALPDATPSRASMAFTVDSSLDEVDANPGDGLCASTPSGACTLRAAIVETNALAGANTVNLPARIYTLTIPGTGEDAAATGDLDIKSDLTLAGAGASTTIIDGNQLDRVIDSGFGNTVTISGVTIRNGQTPAAVVAANNGGGLRTSGTFALLDSVVTNNHSGTSGGGVTAAGTLIIVGSSIYSNTSVYGAAGIFSITVLTLTNSSVYSNTTPDHGGGLWNNGNATIVSSTIRGNTSNQGSGINNYGPLLTVINSTISDNGYEGVFSGFADAVFVNATVSGNAVEGISNYQSRSTLFNTTVTGSRFGVLGYESIITVENSLLAGNYDGDCELVMSLGYNLIQSGCIISGVTTGNILNMDPRLSPLQDNGGPTLTHRPGADSPALNAGNPAGCADNLGHLLATDQRGVARPQGAACDIGAVERVLTCEPINGGPGLAFKLFMPFVLRTGGPICP